MKKLFLILLLSFLLSACSKKIFARRRICSRKLQIHCSQFKCKPESHRTTRNSRKNCRKIRPANRYRRCSVCLANTRSSCKLRVYYGRLFTYTRSILFKWYLRDSIDSRRRNISRFSRRWRVLY